MLKLAVRVLPLVAVVFLMATSGCSGVAQLPSQQTLSASPATLSFTAQAPHDTTQQTVMFLNAGSSEIQLQSAAVTGSSSFSLVKSSLPQSLQPGQSGQAVVAFAPAALGSFTGSLVVTSNPPTPMSVPLTGTVSEGTVKVTISPTTATVQGNTSQPFTATVSGTGNTSVIWSVNGVQGGDSTYGIVSSSGLYTAPACPSLSSVTVTAQSYYDPAVWASAIVSLTAAAQNNSDRYVATNGSDSNDGSACHPWATIQHAANLARPGWTIHVAAGAYKVGNYITTNTSGTSSARIVYLGSYDKSTWTWNTKIVSTGTSVWNVGGQYIDVRGFDMTSTNQSATWGIHAGGAYSRYIDNYIHNIYSDAPGAGIMIGGGADYQQVIGNVIAHIAHTFGGSTDNQGIYVQENHTTVVNNILFDCHKVGIQIWSGAASGKPQYNVVSGNTEFASYRGFDIGAANSSYADHNIITDNIFYANSDLGMYTATGYQGYVGPNNTIAYNNSDGNGTDYYNLKHRNDIVGSPLFVNYQKDGSGDYRLHSGSPCRDAGTLTGAPAFDFLGVARPQGPAPDCGAYEYVP